MATIAVDFDGTIVEHRYPEIGEERPFAIDTLKMLIKDRHKLILWTVREGQLLDDAVNFENNPHFSRKLNSIDYWIDDRNIGGLPDWGTIYRMISHRRTWRDLMREEVRSATLSSYEESHPKKKPWWRL